MKNMEGQTIVKALDLGNGYTLLKFSDGEIGLVQVITPDGLSEDLAEFLAEDKPAKTTKEKTQESKKDTKKEDPEEDPEEYTWKDLQDMDYDELKSLVKENKLDTNPKDFDEDEDDEVEDFRKAIAKEIGVEIPGKKEKKSEKVEENPKDDDYTWEDLEEMDEEELKDLCDEEELETDPDDYEDEEDKLRKAIAKELKIAIPKKK